MIAVGPSGHEEVISLQKVDSLLISLKIREAKKVSATYCRGIWVRILLNPKIDDSMKLISYSSR
jgi:hypothetical protein